MPSKTAHFFRDSLGLVGSLAATLLVVQSSALPRSDEVTAVFPPWWSATRAFEAAAGAGRIVALGHGASVLTVHGDPGRIAHDLRDAGALLVFDSSPSAGCHTATLEPR